MTRYPFSEQIVHLLFCLYSKLSVFATFSLMFWNSLTPVSNHQNKCFFSVFYFETQLKIKESIGILHCKCIKNTNNNVEKLYKSSKNCGVIKIYKIFFSFFRFTEIVTRYQCICIFDKKVTETGTLHRVRLYSFMCFELAGFYLRNGS